MNITLSHDHIAIRVVDYAGTLRWYTEKLDFHVDAEWPWGDMQLAYLSNGTAKVEVLGGATAEPQPDPVTLEPTFQHEGLNHFCLAIEDFDGTLAELRASAPSSSASRSSSRRSIATSPLSRTAAATSSSSRLREAERDDGAGVRFHRPMTGPHRE